MAETSGILPGGNDTNLQEQVTPAESDDAAADTRIAGEGTGGSEADQLEQATEVPLDEDAFPREAADDDSAI